MKQIVQSLMSGNTEAKEVPCPNIRRDQVLIRTSSSLISIGTERMLVEFGKANLLGKAMQQPDKVKQTLLKVKTDGVVATLEAVTSKLAQDLPMGYCNVGKVEETGKDVTDFSVGDRVVSNGYHAEIVSANLNLCAKIPDAVSDEEATFAVPGAIALQGIRLVSPTIGETIVVIGLGLIGLLTVQLLMANGCKVIGIDLDPLKTEIAEKFGAQTLQPRSGEDWEQLGRQLSGGSGVDAVIVTASTQSSAPISQSAQMCRKRGRIVLVGVTGLELSRADFYEKELSFQVSCSYGPGRHDPSYEEDGNDYPIGYVRWTLKRNIEAVLELIVTGKLSVKDMITARYPIDEVGEAYNSLSNDSKSALGLIITYPQESPSVLERTITLNSNTRQSRAPVIAFLGAGSFAFSTLVPAFARTGARLKTVASFSGLSGINTAQKHGFDATTTDIDGVFEDPEINTVVIATRHDSHSLLTERAIRAGKHVFVEKPLAISMEQLNSIASTSQSASDPVQVLVGFNRRRAPAILQMKKAMKLSQGPAAININVNAGVIPQDHWTQNFSVGGGRIVGEVCHFVDLARFLIGTPIRSHHAQNMACESNDTVSIALKFDCGSIANINYFSNGHKTLAKERVEIFRNGGIMRMDNYASLRGYGWPGLSNARYLRRDKGHRGFASAFIHNIQQGTETIPMDELLEVSRICIKIRDELASS